MMFFKILFDYQISFSLLIKKQPFIIFLPKKQRTYDYFYEFASKALHIVIFENFVKSMMSCLSKLKVSPSFCFAFKIPDDPNATITYYPLALALNVLFPILSNKFYVTTFFSCKRFSKIFCSLRSIKIIGFFHCFYTFKQLLLQCR